MTSKHFLILALLLAGCGDDTDYFTEDELLDPANCESCHPTHYREWSGSMHAYAADDPVFLAANARGQEDTGGDLGDFCVTCHAPMAVRLGLTTDGLDLADVPQYAKGITCFFCHSADSVGDDHNNDITLASDQVLRGGIGNPVASPKHRSAYSPLVDADAQDSSRLCGGCHDLVTPAGVHLEKTFEEWKGSVFASEEPAQHLSCGGCHMVGRRGAAAESEGIEVPLRDLRDHTMAAVDVAVTPWPEEDAQRASIDFFLRPTVLPRICVTPEDGGRLDVRLDNVAAGHMFPSGAAHDRRAWVEVHVYDDTGAELFATGVVADGADPDPIADPDLWEMREKAYDDGGAEVLHFWEIREADDSELLKPAVTRDPGNPLFDHSTTKSWPLIGIFQQVARVTIAVHIRPLPYALIDDLEASGHLTIDVRSELPTFTLAGTELEWLPELADAGGCVNP